MMVGSSHPASLLRRLMAGGLAALVLTLSLLAVSPETHHALHAGDSCQAEESCPIVLMAAGVDLPPVAPIVLPPVVLPDVPATLVESTVFVPEPRYLRQPERGPPTRA